MEKKKELDSNYKCEFCKKKYYTICVLESRYNDLLMCEDCATKAYKIIKKELKK